MSHSIGSCDTGSVYTRILGPGTNGSLQRNVHGNRLCTQWVKYTYGTDRVSEKFEIEYENILIFF